MSNSIKKILKANYVDINSIFHTHVSLIRPKGRFQFNRQTLEDFWEVYCECIESNEEDTILGIAEKPQAYLPIIVDIDLKVRDIGQDLGEDLYTEEQLKTVVSTYQSVLRQIVNEVKDEELVCVVLEKNMYQQTKNDITYIKHGFHLHFPYIFLNKVDQEVQVIPRIQNELRDIKLFSNLGIEDSGNVVDKVCCKVPWLLYGARKAETAEPYKVTKIYDSTQAKISLEKAFKNYELYDHKEQLINIKGKIAYYLPRILSIIPWNRRTKEIKRGVISPLKERLKKERKSSAITSKQLGLDETINLAKKLLPMLADYRSSDRNEWMTIGWILFNITEGHPDGLELWCDFSARDEENYDENICIHEWEKMVKKDYTMGTLRHFAKIDNPTEYEKLKTEQAEQYIKSSLDGSHNDVAKALYEEYGDEFVCGSISNKLWFQFKNHIWEQIEEGVFLRMKISGKMVDKYIIMGKKLYDDVNNITDSKSAEAIMFATRQKQVNKLICKLKDCNYKNSIMRESMEVFYDPRFKDKLDTDPFLIAFRNGVYDLKLNVFRPGRPEDFLSKCLPINYMEFSEDDERVQDVYTFLEQVFPDKSVRKYFTDVSSDVFVGGNHEKIVVFWTGEGDNAKSVTQKFFEKMLGKFAIKMNTNNMTGKKPSPGSAYADLARAGGGVRWLVLEEPEGDESINAGTMKHWSGNDSYYARDLFERGKDGREIEPLFKISFICNKLPRIRYADKAVWNRVRVIPFESVFCRPNNPAPETYEEQMKQKRFPMDKEFGKKIPKLVEAFAWVLLEHRKKILNQTRVEPEKIMYATLLYQKQNDVYRQFMEECIMEDRNKTMSLAELYNLFREWYREGFPNQSVPVKNDVEEYFTKLWGTPGAGKKWPGFRHRTLKDDGAGDIDTEMMDAEVNPML